MNGDNPDEKKIKLLQLKCHEFGKMEEELTKMEHDIEISYPEFNEPDDKPKKKSQRGSAYWFDRHLRCLHDLRIIEDHKKKMHDIEKEIQDEIKSAHQ
jgi:hypothetical protein